MKKTIAAVAALTMLFAVVGCGAQEDSSETVAETTVAETTATESAEETEATTEAATVGEVELSEDPVTFEDITFQTPMMWSTANIEGLSVWYPMDGSGALTLQIFDPSTMGLEDETQEEILESLGKNLANGYTVISEVWNTVQDSDAYAITYTPAAEDEVDVAEKMNVSILFYVGDTPYAMTFSNYSGSSPVLSSMDAIMESVQF
jgi:hypothetical protein